MSMKEKEAVLEAAIDQVRGRVPVYAGTGCISTRDTIYRVSGAERWGARMCCPSYAQICPWPARKELYDHYAEVFQAYKHPHRAL